MKTIEHFQLSERSVLRPGDQFRTQRGTGPCYGKTCLGPFSIFRVQGLTQARTRVFADVIDTKTGASHSLYISGPRFKTGEGIMKPFNVRKVKG